MVRNLIDRDTAPGAEPEELMILDIPSLIVPGNDSFHATSAARYLEECLNGSDYWDIPVENQTEENAPQKVIEFLEGIGTWTMMGNITLNNNWLNILQDL